MKKAFRNIPDMEQNYYIDGDKLKEEQSLFDTSVCPKKIIASVIFSVFLVIIQETFFNDLRLLGVKPNLTLVVVLIISSLSTPRFSMVYGLLTGLYLDVIYGRYLGLYAMLFMYAAFVVSTAVVPLLKGRVLLMSAITVPVLFVYEFAESFFARLLMIYSAEHNVLYFNFAEHLTVKLLPEFVYNVIVYAVLAVPITVLWSVIGKIGKKYYRLF